MSFILLFGSVFESLRTGVRKKFQSTGEGTRSEWFWLKINQLFTCHLCMTAQVAIWTTMFTLIILTISMPHFLINLVGFKVGLFAEIILNIGFIFIFAMSIAAVAMGFWNLIEFFPRRLEEQKEFLREHLELEMERNYIQEQKKEEVRRELLYELGAIRKNKDLEARIKKITDAHEAPINIEFFEFKELLEALSKNCAAIGCSASRKDCREKISDEFAIKWCQKSFIFDRKSQYDLKKIVGKTMRKYFGEYRGTLRQTEDSFQHFRDLVKKKFKTEKLIEN
jgi:hypothetical protein